MGISLFQLSSSFPSFQRLDDESVFLYVGRHALSDQAGSEGGQTQGDQAGAAQFRKTQGE